MGRLLLTAGICLIVVGALVQWGPPIPFGRLPGDFHVERPGFSLHIPLATCIVVSLVLSGVMWLLSKMP